MFILLKVGNRRVTVLCYQYLFQWGDCVENGNEKFERRLLVRRCYPLCPSFVAMCVCKVLLCSVEVVALDATNEFPTTNPGLANFNYKIIRGWMIGCQGFTQRRGFSHFLISVIV
jgi:hypothetical protein